MSVLIKGMDMPKLCSGCDLEDYDDDSNEYYCTYMWLRTEKYRDIGRRPDCPLVEVITCKECKHWDGIDCNERVSGGVEVDVTDPQEFCNRGRRKEE